MLTIFIVSWLGYWIDGRYSGTRGWGLVVGFVLGVAVAFRNLVRTALHMQRDIEGAESRDPRANRWTVDPSWLHKDAADIAPDRDPEHTGRPDDDRKPPHS